MGIERLKPLSKNKFLITGNTGFKGGWLCYLLRELGADVIGYSLEPPTNPSLFSQTDLNEWMEWTKGDVTDREKLSHVITSEKPDVVVHMAAQPIVLRSYIDPIGTFNVNVMGTANVLEAVRHEPSVRACISVTSDKCYENMEWVYSYRENDRLGGQDPYSASKGAAELVISSYQRSFFHDRKILASVRAGNVIGGGDWAEKRIIPEIVNCLINDKPLILRNPDSVRPWQHVLEPLTGYLLVCAKMLDGDSLMQDAWNFGPDDFESPSVRQIAEMAIERWGKNIEIHHVPSDVPESKMLRLDCTKTKNMVGWKPLLNVDEAVNLTVDWYKAWKDGADLSDVTIDQIRDYLRRI